MCPPYFLLKVLKHLKLLVLFGIQFGAFLLVHMNNQKCQLTDGKAHVFPTNYTFSYKCLHQHLGSHFLIY